MCMCICVTVSLPLGPTYLAEMIIDCVFVACRFTKRFHTRLSQIVSHFILTEILWAKHFCPFCKGGSWKIRESKWLFQRQTVPYRSASILTLGFCLEAQDVSTNHSHWLALHKPLDNGFLNSLAIKFVLYTFHMYTTFNPTIPLLGILTEVKAEIFCDAQFVLAKAVKNKNCNERLQIITQWGMLM